MAKKKYKGGWRLGAFNGFGILYRDDGIIEYKGDFRNGFYKGKGTINYDTGDKYYDGIFSEGMKEGKGVSYFKSGDPIFEGYWKKDVPWKGKGLHLNKDLKVKYDGDWANGAYDGRGTKYYVSFPERVLIAWWKDGRLIRVELNEKQKSLGYKSRKIKEEPRVYVGSMRNNKRDGYGTEYDENGNVRYEGTWVADLQEGYGVYYY